MLNEPEPLSAHPSCHFPNIDGARDIVNHRRKRFLVEPLERRELLTEVAGTISNDAEWTKAESPYEVRADITVAPGATLAIQPGVEVRFDEGTGISVLGRLVAEGSAFDRITMDRAPGASRWDGLRFADTLQDNRIAFSDLRFGDGQGEAIRVTHARLFIDDVTWTGTRGTILELEHPSLVVRNSHFPTSQGDEVIHGERIAGDEYLIIEGNVFANSNNGGDTIDFLGAERPGPVLQILNNVFLGGGDDGLDLDGADTHIEGNVFMNFRLNTSRNTTANAIATGLAQTGDPNRTEITVVRNIFINNDHAILLKEDAFATIQNNVFVDSQKSAIQYSEVGGTLVLGPGRGAHLDGNIFWHNGQLFTGLIARPGFRTELAVDRSLLPNDPVDFSGTMIAAHDLGQGNIAGDPLFVNAAAGDYRLRAASPARGQGPHGLDIGAYVPGGPVISGVPATAISQNNLGLTVGGPGITHYRYRLDGDEEFGPVTPVENAIMLSDLDTGDHTVDVVGFNAAHEWFAGQTPAFGVNHPHIIAPGRTRSGEILPLVVEVRDWQGQINTLLTAPASLAGPAEPSELRIKKGVGTIARQVTATGSFVVEVSGPFSRSARRSIELVDASFPAQAYAGRLEGDITWDASVERHVTGDLLVPVGSTLTIEAGVRVLLGDKVNVRVEGAILARGTADAPLLFNSLGAVRPWGGIELAGASGQFQHTFFTNGGADTTKRFGHSDSQPVLMANGSTLACTRCFVVNNVGKAFGSRNDARVTLQGTVVSHADTGGEFQNSIVHVTDSYFKDIPSDDGAFVDDDNDGLYLSGVHSTGEPSLFQDSIIIETKDDGIDHNGARLLVAGTWIEGATHEGIAASNSGWVTVEDSVLRHNNQGVEAGYGSPDVTVRNSVIVDNDNTADPDSPITAGIRFGDGYDGRNGSYLGRITAIGVVLEDNGDNVRNFDGTIPGPKPGAIEITHSLTNDPDVDTGAGNLAGDAHFGPLMHLLRGSAGTDDDPHGKMIGRRPLTVRASFNVASAGPTVNLAPIHHPRTAAVDELAIQFSEPVTGFDLSDLSLERNGEELALDAAIRLDIVDQMTYRLAGLGDFTGTSGRYVLRLTSAVSGIINASNVPLANAAEAVWTMGPGDANQDGQFNSLDIVAVLQAGKYNTAQSASWHDGDFDGNGLFDAKDLVLALVTGAFNQGPFTARR